MDARQSFNLICQLQQDRIAKFLRPQSISKSVPNALLISQAALPVGEERSARSDSPGSSRKRREARIQIHRANRREHVARLFWNEL